MKNVLSCISLLSLLNGNKLKVSKITFQRLIQETRDMTSNFEQNNVTLIPSLLSQIQ